VKVPSLSDKEYLILDLLRSGNELYGLEMVTESNGALKRGSVYVTLGRRTKKGYISSLQEKAVRDSGRPSSRLGMV